MSASSSPTTPAPEGVSTLRFLTTVRFGCGARRLLGGSAARLAMRRPLIISDPGVQAAGVLDEALASLPGAAALPSFLDTPPNPTEAAARKAADFLRAERCDGVIGIGGGAAMDLAKAVAILAPQDAPLWEFCNRHPAPRPITDPAPLILAPTTSGSGSEVGRSAVIIFDNGVKAGIGCPGVVSEAICDPELTLGLPPRITAATGMDALSHCVETYCSPTVNPPADAIALDGLARGTAALERAVAAGGSDLDARWQMMMASLEGAVAFQKGMGAVHSLSHPLGALGHHHGTLNAILLPHVLRWNWSDLGPKRATLNAAIAAAPGGSAAEDAVAFFTALLPRIGLPSRLSELGLSEADLEPIPARALEDNAHKTNPRPMDAESYAALLAVAY